MNDQLFRGANAAVMPFWALMLIAPRSRVAQAVMRNKLIFAALAGVYILLLATAIGGGDRSDRDKLVAVLKNPTPENLAVLFSRPEGVAAGWVHYLAFDLFVGRWIYFDALEYDRVPRVALFMTLMAGPAGLLTYLVQRSIWTRGARSATA